MRHVVLATPTHSGDVVCEYTAALIETLPALHRNGIAYTHHFLMGNALVHDARNRLVAWFLDSPATDLLFIDADIGWRPEDAVKIAVSPHDVIGGAYRQKRDEEMYNIGGMRPTGTGLLDVDYLGAGFLKITRRAIEKMIAAYPETLYADRDGKPVYGLFQAPIENGVLTGEDGWFCRRWRELGGKVMLDPDMTFWHVGRKAYGGNFAELAKRVTEAA